MNKQGLARKRHGNGENVQNMSRLWSHWKNYVISGQKWIFSNDFAYDDKINLGSNFFQIFDDIQYL